MREAFKPKKSALDFLTVAAESLTQDNGASCVVALGKYGERGVGFFPSSQATAGVEDGCAVQFFLITRSLTPMSLNLCRDDAREIVQLLLDQYGFQVTTKQVSVTTASVE